MFQHYRETIGNVTKKLKADESVLALIVAGSIAHGFATEDVDVDIMIVISQKEYERRHRDKQELYWERESSTYEGGYVDGKYISADFIRDVARRGSPSRTRISPFPKYRGSRA